MATIYWIYCGHTPRGSPSTRRLTRHKGINPWGFTESLKNVLPHHASWDPPLQKTSCPSLLVPGSASGGTRGVSEGRCRVRAVTSTETGNAAAATTLDRPCPCARPPRGAACRAGCQAEARGPPCGWGGRCMPATSGAERDCEPCRGRGSPRVGTHADEGETSPLMDGLGSFVNPTCHVAPRRRVTESLLFPQLVIFHSLS